MEYEASPFNKHLLVGELLQTSEGRAKILSSMKLPIELQLAYMSMPNRAFYAHRGEVEGVEPEVVEISSALLHLDFSSLSGGSPDSEEKRLERAGGVFTRSLEMCKNGFVGSLGEWFFPALEARATVVSAPFSQEGLDAIASDCMFMNARTYAGLRKSDWFHEHADEECSAAILRTGTMGSYRRGRVLVTRFLPPDTMYSCENLGGIAIDVQPISLELTETGATLEVKCTAKVFWKKGDLNIKKWNILPTLVAAEQE